MNFIAGSYSFKFGSGGGPIGSVVDLGFTETGFEMIARPSFNAVRADYGGRTPRTALLTGLEDLIIRAELIEWSSAAWHVVMDWLNYGSTEGKAFQSGTFMKANLCDVLEVEPVGGEAANIGGTGTATAGKYTFNKACPLEPVRSVFSSQRLRGMSVGFFVFDTTDHQTTAGLPSTMYSTPTYTP